MKFDEYPTGRTVPFPYQNPYPQQVDLMQAILSSLRNENQQQVMFLESPTGTGKSLSLACACIAWLRYQEQLDLSEQTDDKESDSNDNWWETHTTTCLDEVHAKQTARAARRSLEGALEGLRSDCIATNNLNNVSATRQNRLRLAITQARISEKQDRRKRKRRVQDFPNDDDHVENGNNCCSNSFSSQSILYGPRLDGSCASNNHNNPITVGGVRAGSGVRKIIYAARTHSQLSQFTREITKIVGANTRVVALAGRSHMCGYLQGQGLSDRMINEKCLDMQKETSSSKKCPFLASKESISTLALHMLATPTEIEEVASMGKSVQTCAYYASRTALAGAEVVVVPYSMLLCPQTRQALGLSLKNALVIIDEAHNVPEALQSLHATRLTISVLNAALEQLQSYTTKYAQGLCGENVQILSQLCRLLRALQSVLSMSRENEQEQNSRIMSATELLVESKLESINLFRILNYLEQTRLPQKLLGFQQRLNQEATDTDLPKHVSAMSIVKDFIEKLTHGSNEGKIVVEHPKGMVNHFRAASKSLHNRDEAAFRYVLLHPAAFFENVLEEAHSLALVGGTLSPFCHVAAELLGLDNPIVQAAERADQAVSEAMSSNGRPSLTFTESNLTAFTCSHVIPASHVILQCVSHGPRGQILDFRHEKRFEENVCQELGRSVLQLCKITPHGMVLFFPSYSYEGHVVRRWKATGLWTTLASVKKIYREPKTSNQIDANLVSYAEQAASSGALLLAVMGGKMSEGINFADEMARCIGIVGLPYPDITDPVLKEKMATMDATVRSNVETSSITGRKYYHNLCMRAVNQSIGRAIRHAKDYAAIVLFDARYATDEQVWMSLPHWVKTSSNAHARHPVPFRQKLSDIKNFFTYRKN